MASQRVEDEHLLVLNKLLSERGLECIRSIEESLESSSILGESEEKGLQEIEEEQLKEETTAAEIESEIVEEVQVEEPHIFPTPSLRKVLPEATRTIQEYNKLHVLPEKFKTDIDPAMIPRIAHTAHQKYIDALADITGCLKYKRSLAEYWFLDTLAKVLSRAQNDDMDRASQAVLILWFCEWIKEMQQFDAADRKRMMKRFKDNMLSAATFVAEEDHLPTPREAGVHYEAQDTTVAEPTRNTPDSKLLDSMHVVTFEDVSYKCSLRDLTLIIHYIFDLFSTEYQYNLVRSVFTFTPDYNHIDTPYQMRTPKRLFTPLKVKPKKEKPVKKDAKPSPKSKKKDVDTEEYLALLELRAQVEREQEEQEERDRLEWHLKSHILPLSLAAGDELFNKYWPPPPPEPEPVIEPEPKGKGQKKEKKGK